MNNNSIEIKQTNSDCARYTGTVTVATYLGDRLLQKETHHNSGLPKLFNFIGNCLQGNWVGAKYNRPCKLVLLKAGEGEILTDADLVEGRNPVGGKSTPLNVSAVDSSSGGGHHYWSSAYAVCNPIMYDNAAMSEVVQEDEAAGSVTYHFRVPFLSLVGGSSIRKLLLLPPITTDYAADACAYFVLDKEIQVPEFSSNFTVIIDWTLTFTNTAANKNKEN